MKRLFLLLLVLTTYGPLRLGAQAPLAKLIDDDVQQNNAFGDVVALDGAYVVIGAFLDDNDNGEKAGAAYVFHREGTTWTQQARLVGSGVGAEDRFGGALAIDGDHLLVANRAEGTGAVYVYQRDGTTWTEQTLLTASDVGANEELGVRVLFQDPYAFIGGSSIRIFKRDGDAWSHQVKLTTDTAEDLSPLDVSGDYLVASRTFLNAGGSGSVQDVYLFERDGETWVQQARFSGADVGVAEWRSVEAALSGDDLAIAAGTHGGAFDVIYLFKRDASGWSFRSALTPQDAATVTLQITNIAIEGDVIVIGDNNQDLHGDNSGAAYVFRRVEDRWTELAKLIPSDGVAFDRFGISVAMDAAYLLVGQDGHQVGDTLPTGFGAAYVYSVPEIIATGVEEDPASFGFALSAPYPNPFTTQTAFTLSLARQQHVTVGVYDLLGRRVSVLYDGVLRANTPHPLTVAADGWPSGPYLIRVSAERGAASRVVLLMK